MKQRFFIRLSIQIVASVLVSVTVSSIAMQLFIGMIHPVGLGISAVAPILVTTPVSWIFEVQKLKIETTLEELSKANSRLKLMNWQLEQQANLDYLTGILNRRAFVETILEHWDSCKTGALLCIDVDDFKAINDTYGHGVGDQALKQITETICKVSRKQDLLARTGGEEFALFIPETTLEMAEQIAERIRKAVETMTFSPAEGSLHKMSVSIGSAFVVEAVTYETLSEIADLRMYKAKSSGKNCTVFPTQNDLTQAA